MQRRDFLLTGIACSLTMGSPLAAAVRGREVEQAREILKQATSSGQVTSASFFVQNGRTRFVESYGETPAVDSPFLLASISKTITVATLMTLFDEGAFQLDDRVDRYLPEFSGGKRDTITIRHLLTHVSGLPDQLPENAKLRAQHAPLSKFVEAAVKTPLLFSPGTQYSYSSMGILLASEIAERLSGVKFPELVAQRVYQPLGLENSAMGLGELTYESVIKNQVEKAAPESGAGDPSTKNWDWNSLYWRKLGAPWGTAHGSASDVGLFLQEFLHPTGRMLKESTCAMMTQNQNPTGFRQRGLGFDMGTQLGGKGCSQKTFGHTGSTGTICWADPETDTICVVLTSLPGRAVTPHPRTLVSDAVAAGV